MLEVHYLIHSSISKQQRGIIGRNYWGGMNVDMISFFNEVLKERITNLFCIEVGHSHFNQFRWVNTYQNSKDL